MVYETAELGPILRTQAPQFTLQDHEGHDRTLSSLVGERGLLIGFIHDIWKPASIRRILYMQRHTRTFGSEGYNVALVIVDKQYTLWTFHMSSPVTVFVPMLADPDGAVHKRYNMLHPGLIRINADGIVCSKWMMPDEMVWPRAKEVLAECQIRG